MTVLSRRRFLYGLGGGVVAAGLGGGVFASVAAKPILGSWFEFQHHHPPESGAWNPALADFSCGQWDAKIKEIAEIGMEYLVLLCTAVRFKAFYPTQIFPKYELKCYDPLESVLAAADKYGIKFFIGGGFYGDWTSADTITDPIATRKTLQAIEEITRVYAHHPSFYGWYWPNEAFIDSSYSDEYIQYVNTCSHAARSVTPKAKLMIAPYGTRVARPDDKYVRQLEQMDVDIIAYQDEVGVHKSKVTETAAFFKQLRKAHDRVPRVALWADVEVFQYKGEVYRSDLLPAPFERVQRQLEAVSPWVDTILIYQYEGMMNKPGSPSFAGNPASTQLYSEYVNWLKKNHPTRLQRFAAGDKS
jgi:hypothetical protein